MPAMLSRETIFPAYIQKPPPLFSCFQRISSLTTVVSRGARAPFGRIVAPEYAFLHHESSHRTLWIGLNGDATRPIDSRVIVMLPVSTGRMHGKSGRVGRIQSCTDGPSREDASIGRIAIPRFARDDNQFAGDDNRWTTRGVFANLSGRTGRTPSAERAEPTCADRGHNTSDLLSARRADAGALERRSP